VASSFRLHVFLKRDRRFSNTRQGRRCLSIGRRSATVRLCRRKIALPRYQFGLNISALYPNIYVAGGSPAGRFADLASKKCRFVRARRLFRETWFISVEKALYPEKEQAAARLAGELCKGISTKSYIFPEGKTTAKAFPMCLFLQRLQNE
jgi:hypothetical protein